MRYHIFSLFLLLTLSFSKFGSAQPIAINEFLASNSNIVADNYGEFDDYVELINLTSDTLNLLGYYLSDDSTFTTKWPFPDTFLLPNNFLIIWCDDQITQKGLHANFRLGTSGESVVLTSKFLTEVDKINYPDQSTNVSYGRYPDGTGAWRYMYPTPGIGNLKVDVPVHMLEGNGFDVFPNPTNGSFNLSVKEPTHVDLYSVEGKLVASFLAEPFAATTKLNLQKGVYFVRANNQLKKLIVK